MKDRSSDLKAIEQVESRASRALDELSEQGKGEVNANADKTNVAVEKEGEVGSGSSHMNRKRKALWSQAGGYYKRQR